MKFFLDFIVCIISNLYSQEKSFRKISGYQILCFIRSIILESHIKRIYYDTKLYRWSVLLRNLFILKVDRESIINKIITIIKMMRFLSNIFQIYIDQDQVLPKVIDFYSNDLLHNFSNNIIFEFLRIICEILLIMRIW